MPDHVRRVGELLRRHRARSGLTQAELAERADVSIRTLRSLEQGRVRRPHPSSIYRIAAALGLPDRDIAELTAAPRRPETTMPPPPLRVEVLGPLTVWRDGVIVSRDSAMVDCLLGLLAVQPGRPVGLIEITDTLWGQAPPRTSQQLIHSYVARLRRLLEPDRPAGSPSTVLRRVHSGYILDLGLGQLDVVDFHHHAEQARAADDAETAREHYTRALECWRGQILTGAPDSLREHPSVLAVRHRRVEMVENFADLLERIGRLDEATASLHALLADEALHEGVASRLMLAFVHGGQQAKALSLYETLRARLADELGVDPGPQLRAAHTQVLRGVPSHRPPPVASAPPVAPRNAAATPPAQLPGDLPSFSGRTEYLRALDAMLACEGPLAGEAPLAGEPTLLRGPASQASTVVISTVAGMGGVGKTTLAVHWAHHVRDRFPDGQLYVNLRGYAPGRPVRPMEALVGFLSALGVPMEQIPADPDQSAALYRSRLAGKRMLILLDNAADADQVRPLLPADPGCFALVTSRDRLLGLVAREGARPLSLDVLSPIEAHDLLRRALGADRVDAECEAAARLAALCAYLPLALRIAAANLAGRPRRRIADYVAELSARDRLDMLAIDGDPTTAVRAAFESSWAILTDAERHIFQVMGLFPGPDLTTSAVAALADVAVSEAEQLLDRLAGRHLLDEPADRRYAMHDLVRLYATELAGRDVDERDREAALSRLSEHYRAQVTDAASLLYPHVLRVPDDQEPDTRASDSAQRIRPADSPAQALAWLDTEQRNIVALVAKLADGAQHRRAWRLADLLLGYLWVRMDTVQWRAVALVMRACAEQDGDHRAIACAEINLGLVADIEGRAEEAVAHSTAAIAAARAADWTQCHAVALNNLARAGYRRSGSLPHVIAHLTEALVLHRRAGRAAGVAVTLANLGVAQWDLAMQGDLPMQHDLTPQHDLTSQRDPANEAPDIAAYHAGLRAAIDYLVEALALHRQVGDRRNEADTLRILACVHRDRGDYHTALAFATDALDAARAAEDLNSECAALGALGTVRSRLACEHEAVAVLEQALKLAHAIDDRQQLAVVLLDCADGHGWLGQADVSRAFAQQAERIALDAGATRLRARAQRLLGQKTTPSPRRPG